MSWQCTNETPSFNDTQVGLGKVFSHFQVLSIKVGILRLREQQCDDSAIKYFYR